MVIRLAIKTNANLFLYLKIPIEELFEIVDEIREMSEHGK
jgi:hypothetical protein